MQLRQHLHMALVGNGLTLLELSQEPATYSGLWKKLFDTGSYPL